MSKRVEFHQLYFDTSQIGADGILFGKIGDDNYIRGTLNRPNETIYYHGKINTINTRKFDITLTGQRKFLDKDTWHTSIINIAEEDGVACANVMMENQDGLAPWIKIRLDQTGIIDLQNQWAGITVIPGRYPSVQGYLLNSAYLAKDIPLDLMSLVGDSSIVKVVPQPGTPEPFADEIRLVIYAGKVYPNKHFVFDTTLPGTNVDFDEILARIRQPLNPLSFIPQLAQHFKASFRFANEREVREILDIQRMRKR